VFSTQKGGPDEYEEKRIEKKPRRRDTKGGLQTNIEPWVFQEKEGGLGTLQKKSLVRQREGRKAHKGGRKRNILIKMGTTALRGSSDLYMFRGGY